MQKLVLDHSQVISEPDSNYVHVYKNMCTYMHVCQTYILAHTYIRTLSVCFTYVNCSVRMYVLHVYARICTYIRQQILIRAYTYIYVHTFIYGYTCIYVHIHAYTCIRSYTRIHAYTCNTCIYVHIHAYIYIN